MYVYLRYEDSIESISGVTLKDGYRPVVGSVGEDLQLEPAIWFKSMIIDSILIDIDKRQVRWGRARVGMTERVSQELADQSFLCEPDTVIKTLSLDNTAIDGFDDTDYNGQELIEAAKRLVLKVIKKEIDQKEYKTELLRLLHCYVMPAICLSIDDLEQLENALQYIVNKLKTIDKTILDKDRAVQLTESSMAKQRVTILERGEFTRETFILSCDKDFITTFLKHLGKDVDESYQELNIIQGKVDQMKRDTCTVEQLQQIRIERDKSHEKWLQLQEVKEMINEVVIRRNLTTKKRSSKCMEQNVFHKVYVEINERLLIEKEEIHKLCLHKVQISSVREAIELAISELKTDGESVGWQMKSDGTQEHDTDVIGLHGKPKEWQTLEEKVSNILIDTSKDVTKRHNRFCAGVNDKIKTCLNEEKLLAGTNGFGNIPSLQEPLSESFSDYVDITIDDNLLASGDVCRDRRSRTRSTILFPDNDMNVNMRPDSTFRSLVDTVKREIIEHTGNMTEGLFRFLSEYVASDGTVNKKEHNKVWICYQNHMCHKLSGNLEQLYEKAFGNVCKNIFEKMKDMSFEELGIDEPWIHRLNESPDGCNNFHATEVKAPLPSETSSRKSVTSGLSLLSIGYMPIEDLYKMANQEAKQVEDTLQSSEEEFETLESEFCPRGSEQTKANGLPVQQTKRERPSDVLAPPAYNDVADKPPSYTESDSTMIYQRNDDVFHKNSETPSLYEMLQPGLDTIHKIFDENTVIGKLKQITKCYRFVGDQVLKMKMAVSQQENIGCCDELLTVIIVLMTYLNEEDFKKLYGQIHLVLDLKPQCMLGSVHDCSLTNFQAAFQYLNDRLIMQRVRDSNEYA